VISKIINKISYNNNIIISYKITSNDKIIYNVNTYRPSLTIFPNTDTANNNNRTNDNIILNIH